jgi:hypothetical protein
MNADIIVRREGYSMVLFTPESDAAREWLEENLETEGWQWLGDSLALDGRCAPPIVDGMLAAGLEVSFV